MGLDIMGALRRAVTLPKSKNSLSDVLGADVRALYTVLLTPMIDEALDHAVDHAGSTLTGLLPLAENVCIKFFAEWESLIGKPLSSAVKVAVRGELNKAALHFEGASKAALKEALRAALYRVMRV